MFQKLLSNLPFNPSLIGKVSFYTKRLKKETFVRRMGLFFILAAFGVQLFAMVAPAEPSLAASSNDIKYGGFSSHAQINSHCLSNGEFSGILRYFGVSCDAVANGRVRTLNSREHGGQLYSMGRLAYGKPGERAVSIPGIGTYYMRYLWSWDSAASSNYTALEGTRADGTPFFILFDCGNLVIIGPPTPPPAKVISCNNLFMSVPSSSRVALNTKIRVYGQASGANLPPGELVDMDYDYVTTSGQVLGTAQARGIPFQGTLATDSAQREFTVTQPGHYFFRVFVKYDGGSKLATTSFACMKDVYVETPPPPPQKEIECTNLISSFTNGQKIVAGTAVNVRGHSSGRHLGNGERADMYYDYIDKSGKVQGSQKALGVPFTNGSAIDTTPRSFTLNTPGEYTFRLAVKYDGSTKSASGNLIGNCIKKVVVEPPCEDSENNDVAECIILNKKVTNVTQNIPDANNTEAKPGDILVYTLSAKNTSKNTTIKKFIVEESIADILEYADIVNLHGGTKDDRNIVKWPPTDIGPGKTIEKQLTVRVKTPLPQTPTSVSNPGSFDMLMTNVYGTTVNVKLPPTITKTTEQVTTALPNTGPGETLAVGGSVTAVVGYFFARSRLMVKELELVRADYAVSGGL